MIILRKTKKAITGVSKKKSCIKVQLFGFGKRGGHFIKTYQSNDARAKKVILLAATLTMLFLSTLSVHAQTTYCVRSGATGAQNGSDWNNAYTSLPDKLVRGAIYYIADGSYGSYKCSDPTSGSSFITIKKATNTDHGTDSGWNQGYGDGQAVFLGFNILTSNWIIDGTKRNENNWKDASAYGIVIDTKNGNQAGVLVPWNDPLYNISNIVIKYVYFMGGGPDGNSRENDLIMIWSNGTNLTVQRSYFYNAGRDHVHSIGMDNGLFEYNYFYLNESTPEQHSESFAGKYSSDNWVVRYNVFENISGTGTLIFPESTGLKAYGNLFFDITQFTGNGLVNGWSHTPMGLGVFYNNSIVNCNIATVGGFTNGITSKNNIFINNSVIGFQGTHDFNSFSGGNSEGESNGQIGLTSAIFVDYAGKNFRLKSATARGDSSIGSEYNIDMFGNIRGANGVWNRGAFEFSGSSDIKVPTGLKMLPQ